MQRRKTPWLTFVALLAVVFDTTAVARSAESPAARHRIVVTPRGPADGGDFGPQTPGTRTSGLQEALDAAKKQNKEVYLTGGSWTAGQTEPVVYFLHETLRIPWMQNFRLDGGHCVIHYAKKTGDAIVFDSQMSCSYRLGLVVSESDGAVVALRPTSTGPDRFTVITSTDFHFNALVGGGGAWPGGEAYNSNLDPKRRWIGTGLCLDATHGPVVGNQIVATEVVGCDVGVKLIGPCTQNSLEATYVHLCQTHLQVGVAAAPWPAENRITAHLESEGIAEAAGAVLFGRNNLLTLGVGRMADRRDVVFESSAQGNRITATRLPHGITNRAELPTNRIVVAAAEDLPLDTPAVPPSGQTIVNRHPQPVEVRVLAAGEVHRWTESPAQGAPLVVDGGLSAGQSFLLNPGDGLTLEYQTPPSWRWKAIR